MSTRGLLSGSFGHTRQCFGRRNSLADRMCCWIALASCEQDHAILVSSRKSDLFLHSVRWGNLRDHGRRHGAVLPLHRQVARGKAPRMGLLQGTRAYAEEQGPPMVLAGIVNGPQYRGGFWKRDLRQNPALQKCMWPFHPSVSLGYVP